MVVLVSQSAPVKYNYIQTENEHNIVVICSCPMIHVKINSQSEQVAIIQSLQFSQISNRMIYFLVLEKLQHHHNNSLLDNYDLHTDADTRRCHEQQSLQYIDCGHIHTEGRWVL